MESAASGSQRSTSVRRCTVLVRQTPAALPTIISALTDRTPRKMPSSHMLLSFASSAWLSCPWTLSLRTSQRFSKTAAQSAIRAKVRVLVGDPFSSSAHFHDAQHTLDALDDLLLHAVGAA